MKGIRKATIAWLGNVGLAGSILGVLEGLWRVWRDAPLSLAEALLLLAWASMAYAIPALLLGGAWIGIIKLRNRSVERVPKVPGPLLALGVWVSILAASQLHTSEALSANLVKDLASVALAVGLCLLLRSRWPTDLNLLPVWALLHALTFSAAASWLAVRYMTGGQVLVVTPVTLAAGAFCVWGLASSARRTKALVVAGGFGVSAVVLFVVWPVGHGQATARTDDQQSVILITVDTLRADHLGSYGYTNGQTTTIDKMAADGVLFEEVYASSPFTCPSHTSILTGLDPFQHGAFKNGISLRPDILTLPEMLSDHGYETAAFVSGWTLKHRACGLGTRFQIYREDFSPIPWLPESTTRIRAIRRVTRPIAKQLGLHLERIERPAAETTDMVLRWVEQTHDRPFFLWVHYFDPHIPYAPPPPYDRFLDPNYTGVVDGRWYTLGPQARELITTNPVELRHMISRYDGEVMYVDHQIGRLREGLARLGLDRKTLVIFTSDHGESHGEHLRYFGRDLYRSSLHVPLIFHFPPGEVQPRHMPTQVRLIDIAPTILEYLQIGTKRAMKGKSLLPFIHEQGFVSARPVFAVFPREEESSSPKEMFALQDRGFKLIWSSAWWYSDGVRVLPREELYHLQSDPRELDNIVDQAPSALPDLRRRLTRWRQQKLPTSRPPTGEARSILKSLGYIQ